MLREIVIDAETVAHASEARRREWGIEIEDLLSRPDLALDERVVALHVALRGQGFQLSALDDQGNGVVEVHLPHDALRRHIQEYAQVVRQMDGVDQGMASARLEALDMAKKVTHDGAGRTLRRLCRPLGIDMQTGRRLFSLLFSLKVDTTELFTVRAHRPIR